MAWHHRTKDTNAIIVSFRDGVIMCVSRASSPKRYIIVSFLDDVMVYVTFLTSRDKKKIETEIEIEIER